MGTLQGVSCPPVLGSTQEVHGREWVRLLAVQGSHRLNHRQDCSPGVLGQTLPNDDNPRQFRVNRGYTLRYMFRLLIPRSHFRRLTYVSVGRFPNRRGARSEVFELQGLRKREIGCFGLASDFREAAASTGRGERA